MERYDLELGDPCGEYCCAKMRPDPDGDYANASQAVAWQHRAISLSAALDKAEGEINAAYMHTGDADCQSHLDAALSAIASAKAGEVGG